MRKPFFDFATKSDSLDSQRDWIDFFLEISDLENRDVILSSQIKLNMLVSRRGSTADVRLFRKCNKVLSKFA